MDYDYLRATDGTGLAALAHVETARLIGSSVLDVDNVDNYPTGHFVYSTGTVGANGFIDPSTITEMLCHVNAGNVIIDGYVPGFTDQGNTAGQVGIIKQTGYWVDKMVELALVSHKNNGEIDPNKVLPIKTGWNTGVLPAPNSVVHNGNRSYTLTFNAVNYTGIISEGMKGRATRTVAAPTYMAGLLNGSNHYFVKATPTGALSTVTNNFTLMGWIEPTSYATCAIGARTDAAVNNSLEFGLNSAGQVRVTVVNGGAANVRYIDSVQSVQLNKKTHIAVSWSSGTVVIYIDGVSVPVTTASTGGTAPTTAGTGGDFAVGRRGSSSTYYFPGYISGVAVFDAVLAAATIRSYIPQVLSGAEANCIGAWSLNNTGVNQQAAGTNDLAAMNSAGYTVRSPYGNYLGGVLEYFIFSSKPVFSTNTTVTVQVPEGCALPVTGGISSLDYSTQEVPYLFPRNKNQWEVSMIIGNNTSSSGTVTNTVYNPGGANLNLPIGAWSVLLSGAASSAQNASFPAVSMGLSTSNSAFTNTLADFFQRDYNQSTTTNNTFLIPIYRTSSLTVSVATPLYILVMSEQAISGLGLRGALSSSTQPEQTRVVATPAWL